MWKYALVNISSGEFISEKYDSMSSSDGGKTFLIKNSDSKWGYMNSSGKELGWFTDADSFVDSGKYAPAIKDNKMYLIDKSMNQVSKTLKADSKSWISSLGSDLFRFSYNDKVYLITYNGTVSASDTSKPAATTLKVSRSGSKIKFSWKAVKDIDKYQIYYSADGGKTYKKLGNIAANKTSATTSKLDTSKSYKFKMRSYKTVNGKKVYSSFSKTVTLK